MPDAEATELKRPVERKKHPRVVNILKESVGATTITKRILDLGVNLTVDELLASAPAVEKQLTKAISEDEAVQFRVNTLESNAVEARKSHSWYSMGSQKAKVTHPHLTNTPTRVKLGIKYCKYKKEGGRGTGRSEKWGSPLPQKYPG